MATDETEPVKPMSPKAASAFRRILWREFWQSLTDAEERSRKRAARPPGGGEGETSDD